MPTTVSSASNYAGKAAGSIIGASFKEADTIRLGLVTVLENVNFVENLRRIRLTNGRVAYACGFEPTGDIILSEKTVTPIKLMIPGQVCKETFRNQWGESIMGASAANPILGSDIQGAILSEALADNAEDCDAMMWTGNNATNSNEWTGFIPLFAADAAVKIATTARKTNAAVTAANVVAALDNATFLIPIALRRKNLIVAVGPDVADAYTKALIAAGVSNGLGGNANTGLVYGRYSLTVVNGLPENTIVIYERKNLVFATGLLGDHNTIAIVDEDEIGLLTGMVRYKMVYNGAVGYYNSEDIVYYLTTANP